MSLFGCTISSKRRFIHSFVVLYTAEHNRPLPKTHTTDSNFYSILDLDREATRTEIKGAYLQRSKLFHPDLNKTTIAKDIYSDIREAYEILSDYNSRREYDKLLYKQEVHDLRKNRRITDFDDMLSQLREKKRDQYRDNRPPPTRDHKINVRFDDLFTEDMEGNKPPTEDDFLSKDDTLRTDSKQFKRFEKFVHGSTIFRILLLLFLSSGPLTMAIVSDR